MWTEKLFTNGFLSNIGIDTLSALAVAVDVSKNIKLSLLSLYNGSSFFAVLLDL